MRKVSTYKTWGGALLVGLLTTLNAAATTPETEGDGGFQGITTEVQTPHFDWMAPPLEKAPAVVFFVPRQEGRGVVELCQRWPMRASAIFWGRWFQARESLLGVPDPLAYYRSRIFPESRELTEQATLARFDAALRASPDVLVTGEHAWSLLPPDRREVIWQRVRKGMGLVSVRPTPAFSEDLARQQKEAKSLIPPQLALPVSLETKWEQRELGAGRVIVLDPRKSLDVLIPRRCDEREYELLLSLLLRAIQQASAEVEAATFTLLESPGSVEWSSQAQPSLKAHIESRLELSAELVVDVMDDQWRPVGTRTQAIKLRQGANLFDVPLPPARVGRMTAVLRIRSADKYAAFGCAEYEVSANVEASLTPDASLVSAGQPVTATLRMKGMHADRDRLVVRLRDYFGRVTAEQVSPPADGERSIRLNDTAPLSRWQSLELQWYRDGMPFVHRSTAVYRSVPMAEDRFRFFFWSGTGGPGYFDRILMDRHKSLGINTAFNPGSAEADIVASIASNLDLFTITQTGMRTLRELCDPKVFEQSQSTLLNYATMSRGYGGQWAMSHGDELYVRATAREDRDVMQEPASGAFRAFLQRRYAGDISALNRAWSTHFTSFDGLVIPKDIDVPVEPRAPWLDYCRFLRDAFTSYHGRLNNAVWARFPDTRIGMDGIEQFSCYDGIDWPALQQSSNCMIIYPHIDHDTKLYSWRAGIDFRKPGTPSGFWLAYDSEFVPAVARQYPWMALFHGLNSIGYFQSYDTRDIYSALYPDWRPRPAYRAVAEEVQTISGGIDRLLLGANRIHSPIAVHYSSASWALSFPDMKVENHVNQLGVKQVSRTYRAGYQGSVAASASGFLALLTDCGYQPRMVSTEQIESGTGLEGYRVLVLPYSTSLTDGEVAAIRKFVERGGLLIADYAAGTRDGNGNLRDGPGPLDDLFGIERTASSRAITNQPVAVSSRPKGDGKFFVSLRLDEATVGGALRVIESPADATSPAAWGEARDGTPVCIARFGERSRTLYLNFALDRYFELRATGRAEGLREMMSQVMANIGRVAPSAEIARSDAGFAGGQASIHLPEPSVERWLFEDGSARYLGMLWNHKTPDWSPRDVVVTLPVPAHVYDVMTGAYLGYTDQPRWRAGALEARLLALLPYRVERIDTRSGTQTRAGEPCAITFSITPEHEDRATVGRHVLRIRVKAPDGKAIAALDDTAVAPNGQATWTWTPAFDDPEGAYQVTATDVATGISTSTTLTLKR